MTHALMLRFLLLPLKSALFGFDGGRVEQSVLACLFILLYMWYWWPKTLCNNDHIQVYTDDLLFKRYK